MDSRYILSGMTTISVIPAVGGGDPSEKNQDGFPMTNVGNDPDGYGFPKKHYEADYV